MLGSQACITLASIYSAEVEHQGFVHFRQALNQLSHVFCILYLVFYLLLTGNNLIALLWRDIDFF